MPSLEHIEIHNPSDIEPAWERLFADIRDHPNVVNPGAAGIYLDIMGMRRQYEPGYSYYRRIRRLQDGEDPEKDWNYYSPGACSLDNLFFGKVITRPREGCLNGECEATKCECSRCGYYGRGQLCDCEDGVYDVSDDSDDDNGYDSGYDSDSDSAGESAVESAVASAVEFAGESAGESAGEPAGESDSGGALC